MQALMDVVGGIKVTAEYAAIVLSDQALDDFSATRMMILIIADAGRTHTPDVAIAAIFAPARLISLHGRTGTNLLFEGIQVRLHVGGEPVQQFHNLATADGDSMQREQI